MFNGLDWRFKHSMIFCDIGMLHYGNLGNPVVPRQVYGKRSMPERTGKERKKGGREEMNHTFINFDTTQI